jgi:uncharacterized protein (DUF1778 family)
MAMTLRLTDEEDRVLTDLARVTGTSKQDAAVRAILSESARVSQDSEVRRLTQEAIERYGPLLDRLAQ